MPESSSRAGRGALICTEQCGLTAWPDNEEETFTLTNARGRLWWTGVPATDTNCPGLTPDGILHSLPIPDLIACSREQVMDYFDNSWTLTELLFSSLTSEEAFFRPPAHRLRHPLVFYYIHPAALYVNKLRLAGIITAPVDAYYESLFETGVDEMSWDDMSKNTMDWPALQLLHDYRRRVYQKVRAVIACHQSLSEGHAPIDQNNPLWALFMAFEHERIHIETSSVLIRELPVELVKRPLQWPTFHPTFSKGTEAAYHPREGAEFPPNKMLNVPRGDVLIGKPLDFPTYGWDNEYGHSIRQVEEFEVSKNLISNGDFWQFVAEGGYLEEKYWSETGWKWRSFRNTKWPTFWSPNGPAGSHLYRLRTLFDLVAMPWSCPVIVNFHEAQAYCQWRSQKDNLPGSAKYRLISESEHNRLRDGASNLDQGQEQKFNLNLSWGCEAPVGLNQEGLAGVSDLFGNVWQWCEDQFNPLPGFCVHKFYDDFSLPCFDGEHQMIIGGSFMSSGDMASQWARFHFRPHFFQHAGFRIVSSTGDGAAIKIG